ncbi:hypothetical protein Tco_0831102 [Tanacetum coccineum]
MKDMREGCNNCEGTYPSSDCNYKPMGGPEEETNYFIEDIKDADITEVTMVGVMATNMIANREMKIVIHDLMMTIVHHHEPLKLNTMNLMSKKPCDNSWSLKNATRPSGTLTRNTQPNPKQPFGSNVKPYRLPPARKEHVNVVFTRSDKMYDPPPNPKDKTTNNYDDIDDEAAEEEKMEERYGKFIDMIKEVRINVALVDVLAGISNYEKFVKDLVSNKSKIEQSSVAFFNEECSIIVQNILPSKLGDPVRFLIPLDFVILKMEEDSRVPLILGRPFLHTVNAIIRVKGLGVGDDRISFLIDKAMQHSHFNDETCFNIDVFDEIMEEELDAWVNDSEPFMSTSEKINEIDSDKEFEEFMAVEVEEISIGEEEINDNFEELPFEEQLRKEDSPWVSPVHCVPKKGGMTVVTNERTKLVPTQTVTGWRVCIDDQKLNDAKRIFSSAVYGSNVGNTSREKILSFF